MLLDKKVRREMNDGTLISHRSIINAQSSSPRRELANHTSILPVPRWFQA